MTRARLALLLLVLTIAGGLGWGFMPRPVAVDMATVTQGPLTVNVEEEGKTRVRDRYVIHAPMSGHLRRIELKVGDPVRPGQVLAVLEPARADALDPRTRAQAQAQARAAEAALAAAREDARAAEAEALLARQELARAEALGRAEFLSRAAVDQARTRVDRSDAAREAARHAVDVARHQLETARAVLARAAALQAGGPTELMEVRAPVAGRVLKLVRESEGAVAAGQALLEIGNPQALEVEVEVLSTQAVRIEPGARVLLERWGGPPLEARVRLVEPAGFTKVSALGVEEQRVRVIVDITAPRETWQTLGDGYRVDARFVLWEAPNVLQVPASSLFRHDDGWAVFVVEAGRAHLRKVELGQRAGLAAQILSGLTAGEQVVAHPDDRIRDGIRVRPRP
ncbi:MAG: efflux RND transporter periplasmic adaptor subunit [Thiobacillaceae bacterium]